LENKRELTVIFSLSHIFDGFGVFLPLILGKIFYHLIPLSVRVPVASFKFLIIVAYYSITVL
jgi:hypothetical protein